MIIRKEQEENFDNSRQFCPTKPSLPKGSVPEGKETIIGKDVNTEEERSLNRENEAAKKLSSEGYKVEQNPAGQSKKNPDYKIEEKVFDCYSPKTSNARNIMDTVSGKVGKKQADRIIVNLADSDVSLKALKQELAENPIADLKEIIVLTKSGDIVQLFP